MWRQLLLVGVLLMALAGPVLLPYLSTHRELGFVRSISSQASLTSYAAASRLNVLYGDLTSGVQRPEANLFPGALALVLALLGAVGGARLVRSDASPAGLGDAGSKRHAVDQHVVLTSFDLAILVFVGIAFAILVTGGGTFSLLGLGVSAETLVKPVLWLVGLIVARLLVRRIWLPGRWGGLRATRATMADPLGASDCSRRRIHHRHLGR